MWFTTYLVYYHLLMSIISHYEIGDPLLLLLFLAISAIEFISRTIKQFGRWILVSRSKKRLFCCFFSLLARHTVLVGERANTPTVKQQSLDCRSCTVLVHDPYS